MLAAARAAKCRHDRTLIAGVGRESTRATIAAARRAAARRRGRGAGPHAVVLPRARAVPALVAHYTAIADASPVPVLLYNYAAFTGVNLSPETIARLAQHPNIVGHQGNQHRRRAVRGTGGRGPGAVHHPGGIGAGRLHRALRGRGRRDPRGRLRAPELCLRAARARRARAVTPRRSRCQQRLTPLARAVTTGFGIAGPEGRDGTVRLRPAAIHVRRSRRSRRDGMEKIRRLLMPCDNADLNVCCSDPGRARCAPASCAPWPRPSSAISIPR